MLSLSGLALDIEKAQPKLSHGVDGGLRYQTMPPQTGQVPNI
jgi:hypothetical protein